MNVETKIEKHLRSLPPHVKERESAKLLKLALDEILFLKKNSSGCSVNAMVGFAIGIMVGVYVAFILKTL